MGELIDLMRTLEQTVDCQIAANRDHRRPTDPAMLGAIEAEYVQAVYDAERARGLAELQLRERKDRHLAPPIASPRAMALLRRVRAQQIGVSVINVHGDHP